MRQQAQAEMQEAQQRFARFSAVSKKESGYQGPLIGAVTSAYTALVGQYIDNLVIRLSLFKSVTFPPYRRQARLVTNPLCDFF
ncbi:hypothetical protein DFO67_1064 [Modicisalibacter xianhensis]|uniref:Uncharacterized protein n=1 Tax=Modicisalibacter xianhensis TaxID=442341 RepID=A0A4R8G3S8_9GAMM|nr:hypothetical protein [Halomonas xianhensis]TDX29766.1 hypothetical protein DFO67_1064 [Halomonas xianhensis]